MNGTQLFKIIEPRWRANMASRIPQRLLDRFIAEERDALVAILDEALAARRAARAAKTTQEVDDPPELWTKAQRTRANLAALQLVASKKPEDLTPSERRQLLAYSSWGGLSLEDVKDQLPAGLEPDDFDLLHSYFTPLVITDAIAEHICPKLPELAGHDSVVRVLEPSAGIGRFLRAMGRPSCVDPTGPVRGIEWLTVEISKVTSRLLTALRPDVRHHHMPFERFIREHGSQYAGRVHLVLSNPPYGERGAFASEDPHPFYRERKAYPYFMRRALDLLVPGGLGVFIVPGGFLTGDSQRDLRAKILARHHLAAAFRLPSHTASGRAVFPGASVVVDVLFFRARGGELTEIDDEDRFILDGKYYEHFPTHLLGKPAGEVEDGDDEAKSRRQWRYKVVGDFHGIPAFEERPMCAACAVRPIATEEPMHYESGVRSVEEPSDELAEPLRSAVDLGLRIDRYLAAVAANDADKAEGMWVELRYALLDFARRPEIEQAGSPWRYLPLRRHAERSTGAQQLLNAFTPQGELAPALAEPPKVTRKFTGAADDVLAQAEFLFRQRGHLKLPALEAFHRQVGGALERDALLARLLAGDWNLDHEDEVVPLDVYVTGELWPKVDRVRARAGDPQAALQLRRLMEAIAPSVFEDISDITPSQRWVPIDLTSAWLSQTYNAELGRVELERVAGLTRVRGQAYGTTDELPGLTPETVWILGWINHDKKLFDPDADDDDRDAEARRKKAELRALKAKEYAESFHNWLRDDADRRQQIADAYNREFRGIITPQFTGDPLPIARWGDLGPILKPHQIAGARRLLALRRGMLAFDVGVGKTFTGIAVIAVARQEGWVRRPVVLVPSSLVWKWYDDFRCCLPDYKVLVIGSNRKRITRGKRKGVLTSETDTPEERAQKWQAFQAGQADVVILSFDALSRTKMNEDAVVEYARQVEGIRREVAIRQRNARDKTERGGTITERQQAILKHGVRAFVQEHLELPEGHRYDPGIAWDDLGVDLLMVDEAAAFKNLYMPEEREAGVPKFMGGTGDGSQRAWQLDFRAAVVRRNTGGAGVMLLTATPAKNSPLEFYNLIQMIDPRAFSSRLSDPEQFIDRYLQIEIRDVLGVDLKSTQRSAVVGFKNLDELRNIILTYGEFRTAKDVGLKLPKARIQIVEVDMDARQAAKYDRYVSEMEAALKQPKEFSGGKVLGMLANLSLVALHSQLDGGYNWKNALTGGESIEIYSTEDEDGNEVQKTRTVTLPKPDFHAPKLVACAQRIAAQRSCGHIVFCSPTAVHAWMVEALVEAGVPRERIAVLNASTAKPADRVRVAREFNGLPPEPPQTDEGCAVRGGADFELSPRYDVVIANEVVYEGVDMQVRTCIIHHLDLPWTPSDLEQRNGRAYRQGNRLETLEIIYYMSRKSMDGYRFGLIDGKANWLGAILESGRRDTNNPAAQQQLSPDEILVMISRNPAETAKRVEEAKAKAREEERLRVAREAARLMTQANARFRDARATTDPDRGAQLRAEGHTRLRQLRKYEPEVWPWARWIDDVEHVEYLVPPDGQAPVYEGLRVGRPSKLNPDAFEHLEFGRLVASEGAPCIGVRQAGSARWVCQNLASVVALGIRPEDLPGGPVPWDSEDEKRTAAALDDVLQNWSRRPRWRALGWTSASDAWLERWWPRSEVHVRDALAVAAEPETVPVLVGDALRLLAGPKIREGTLVPPTFAGWQRFLELAPASEEKFTDLKKTGDLWWARRIPQTLLSAGRDDETEDEPQPDSPAVARPAEDEYRTPTPVVADDGSEPKEVDYELGSPLQRAPETLAALDAQLNLRQTFKIGGRTFQFKSRRVATTHVEWTYASDAHDSEDVDPRLVLAVSPGVGPTLRVRATVYDGRGQVAQITRKTSITVAQLNRLGVTQLADVLGLDVFETTGHTHEYWLDTVAVLFAQDYGYQLREVTTTRHAGVTIAISSKDHPDEVLASIDLSESPAIEDVRWLADLRPGLQREILERLEQILARVAEGNDHETRPQTPKSMVSLMTELLDARTRRLREPPAPAPALDSREGQGMARLAFILRQLAEPGISPRQTLSFLEENRLYAAAGLLARYLATPSGSLEGFMDELWAAVLEDLAHGYVRRDRDGSLWVDPETVRDGAGGAYLLAIWPKSPALQRIDLHSIVKDSKKSWQVRGDRLEANMIAYSRRHADTLLGDLHTHLDALRDSLKRAPEYLRDVRRLLALAGGLIDTAGCQGEHRTRTLEALEQAKAYYDAARRELVGGRTGEALERIRQAMERIAIAAARLAEACAAGEQELAGVQARLEVSADDRAALGGAHAARLALTGQPAVVAMAGAERPRSPSSRTPHRRSPQFHASADKPESGVDWSAIGVELERRAQQHEGDIVATMDRLLRIYSGGLLGGRRLRAGTVAVERVAGEPEFPTLVLPTIATIARSFDVGATVAILSVLPFDVQMADWVYREELTDPEVARIVARIQDNVAAYYNNKQSHEEFSAKNVELWNEATRAGVSEVVSRHFGRLEKSPTRTQVPGPQAQSTLAAVRSSAPIRHRYLFQLFLQRIPDDAEMSAVGRWVHPEVDHVQAGRGAWDGALNVRGPSTCTRCPFVLGSNLDCETCRRRVFSQKQPGPPWTAQQIRDASLPGCPPQIAEAAVAALAESAQPPLTASFFAEFAARLASRLPVDEFTDWSIDDCRRDIEWLFPRPDFPLPGQEEV